MSERGRKRERKPVNLWLSFLILAAIGITADQFTKWIVFRSFAVNFQGRVDIIQSFLSISPCWNTGGVFGVFQGHSSFFTVLAVFSLIVVGWLSWSWMRHSPGPSVWVSLSAILAGAVGNLIDRIYFGPVRDFIDVHIGSYSWPTFNLADAFITVGAISLALSMIAKQPAEKVETRD